MTSGVHSSTTLRALQYSPDTSTPIATSDGILSAVQTWASGMLLPISSSTPTVQHGHVLQSSGTVRRTYECTKQTKRTKSSVRQHEFAPAETVNSFPPSMTVSLPQRNFCYSLNSVIAPFFRVHQLTSVSAEPILLWSAKALRYFSKCSINPSDSQKHTKPVTFRACCTSEAAQNIYRVRTHILYISVTSNRQSHVSLLLLDQTYNSNHFTNHLLYHYHVAF